MKWVLLDENVDRKLKRAFDSAYEVLTVRERGWDGMGNGELLHAAEAEFDVLVTLDRNLQHQQHLSRYDLAIVLITAPSSRRKDVERAMPEVNKIIGVAEPGKLYVVSA